MCDIYHFINCFDNLDYIQVLISRILSVWTAIRLDQVSIVVAPCNMRTRTMDVLKQVAGMNSRLTSTEADHSVENTIQ